MSAPPTRATKTLGGPPGRRADLGPGAQENLQNDEKSPFLGWKTC